MQTPIEVWEMLLRLLAASACGAIIGWEREAQNKPAGLRTHMLVSLGSAGFTLVTWSLCSQLTATDGNLRLDPLRLIDGIIGGIGFLGAGAIIQSQGSVRGMTSAAAIWVVGAVGVACGLGYYVIALLVVAICIAILYPLGYFESRLRNKEDNDAAAGG